MMRPSVLSNCLEYPYTAITAGMSAKYTCKFHITAIANLGSFIEELFFNLKYKEKK